MSDIGKSVKIKATMRRNRERREKLGVAVYQLKIDESHLSKSVRRSLEKMFLEAKWLYNSVLNNKAFEYDASLKNVGVYVFNKETEKCDILEERPLTLGSQIKQSIVKRACQNIINLSKAKKSGKSIGKLKFKKEVNCVPLKQFGNTFRICGKNYLRIQGVGKIRVSGLLQLAGKDIACANLTRKASGFFVRVTCYEEKKETQRNGAIGIDMGIKDTLVFSDGRKVNVRVKIPRRLKRLQKNLSRKKRGSRRYVKNKIAFKKVCEKLSRRKDDIANKLVNNLKGYSLVAIQDENLSGWQAGHFGKTLSESVLGRIKTKIKRLETSVVIDRFLPTTKFSPVSFKNLKIKLSDRTFADGEYKEDRDVKAAKTILCFAAYKPDLTRKELMGLSVEELTTMFGKFYFPTQVSPVKRKAASEPLKKTERFLTRF